MRGQIGEKRYGGREEIQGKMVVRRESERAQVAVQGKGI
jgi:hypothetical protein